jgi:hypothetical protein
VTGGRDIQKRKDPPVGRVPRRRWRITGIAVRIVLALGVAAAALYSCFVILYISAVVNIPDDRGGFGPHTDRAMWRWPAVAAVLIVAIVVEAALIRGLMIMRSRHRASKA